MELSNKIKIEVESDLSDQTDQSYREVRRSEMVEQVEEVPVFKRRKFDPNKISPAMLRDHCRYYQARRILMFYYYSDTSGNMSST